MAKQAAKGHATNRNDIILSLKPRTFRKKTSEIKSPRMQISHRLDELLERYGRLTVGELCDQTGYRLSQVLKHVNYIIDIGVAELLKSHKPPQGSLSTQHPSLHGIAKHIRGSKDGQPPAKHQIFELWLKDPVGAQRDIEKIAKTHGPKPTLKTIRNWMSNWRKGLVDEKSGGFYPPSLRGREGELAAALEKLKTAAGDSTTAWTRVPPAMNFAGEFRLADNYVEGAVTQVIVNRYERDPKARAACLSHFGDSCDACGMNFREQYGEIGEGFIHVHHRKPLALRKVSYKPDPIVDLVPVCPNCHAMLHTTDPPLEIDALRKLMKTARRCEARGK